MCCIWQYMAYTVIQSRCHIPVWAVYGSIWHILSPRAGPTSLYLLYMAVYGIFSPPEQGPHPCICYIWQCMGYTFPQSRPYIPVCAVYGSLWDIHSPRAGPTSLYVLYMAVYGIYFPPEHAPTSLYVLYMAVYGIYIPPEQALHPCMCCIWQCMAYTVLQSRRHIPVYAVYGSVWLIESPGACPTSLYVLHMAVYAIYSPPRAGATSLYVLYMAVYGIYCPPEQGPHPCICCIWQCMAYTVRQSRCHISVCALYSSIGHIQSSRAGTTSLYVLYMAVYGIYSHPEQVPHPCMGCIWQYMAYTVPQSRAHIPVSAVYGSVWHIQSPRAGPTSLYMLYMAVYGIYIPPEQALHPCMCCIWQFMGYTFPQSRPYIPVCAVYGSVWDILSARACPYIPVCAVYGSVWDIHSPRAGPTSLYVLYMAVYGIYSPPEQAPHPCICCIWQCMAYRVPRSMPHIPGCAAYGSVWHIQSPQSRCHIPVCAVYGSIWHIQSSRAGATSLYLLYMAVYGIFSPPEQGPHPCICCIWQCMAYRVPRSRPHIPVCAAYGSV